MVDAPPGRLRRGLVLVLVVVVLGGVAAGVVALVRARQVERSAPALCEQLALAQDLDESLTTLDPATLDPQVDALRQAERTAPEDIRPAVATVSDYVSALAVEVDATDGDRRQALIDALATRQNQVDEVSAAGEAVDAWAEANCGLSLSGAPATLPPTPDPSSG